ncbi:MAG: flagellar hook-basal body protein [Deltaproteobacteria bacterium]|nr:flagellar hook-basal body protein [Deltaproteobacteria bacterium]MBW2597131.1 flagellar hook-basal body protein [Deltaproteobacteria bacterium]
MISGSYNLIDGSLTQQLKFETVANNMANMNTNGFKKNIISFNEALEMNSISKIDFTQGPVRYTGNELDVALDSKGFFKIQTANGIRYTRDGAFKLDETGTLATWNGDSVLGQNGPITIDGSKVSIGGDGQVQVDGESVDRLMVVDFESPQLLKKEGGSCYSYTGEENEISTVENVRVQQNYLESSNVNSTEEMIKMIETYRVFESVQKAIQSIDKVTDKMVNDYGLVP